MTYTYDLKNNDMENRLAYSFWFEHSETSQMIFNDTCDLEHTKKFYRFLERQKEYVSFGVNFIVHSDPQIIVTRNNKGD